MGWLEFRWLEVRTDSISGEATQWKNIDIVPMPPYRRTWSHKTFTAFWSINNICLSAWLGATALLPLGLSVGNAMGVIVVSNCIIAALTVANGWMGAKYHIGFTMTQRTVFGIYGSYIGLSIRVVLSVVWFGSQAWLGGLCVNVILSSWSQHYLNLPNTFPARVHMTSQGLIGFVIFQVISIPWAMIPPEKVNIPAVGSNVIAFFAMLGIVIWAGTQNHGVGTLVHTPNTVSGSQLAWAWVYGISSWFGSLVVGVINMSDFTRFATYKKVFWPGTVFAIVVPGSIVPLFGIITASATAEMYNLSAQNILWNPIDLILYWLQDDYSAKSRAAAFFLGLSFLISQLCQNTLGNAYSGGMDLAGALPKYIDIRRGAVITCLLSWVVQPWLFYNTSSTFLLVMSSFSVFLTPLLGIMLCDFLIIRRRKVLLADLYHSDPDGAYYFTRGFNFRTIIVWGITFAIGLPGMINYINPNIAVKPELTNFFKGSLFFEFSMAVIMYYLICLVFPLRGAGQQDPVDYFGTFTPDVCNQMGIAPIGETQQESYSSVDEERKYH